MAIDQKTNVSPSLLVESRGAYGLPLSRWHHSMHLIIFFEMIRFFLSRTWQIYIRRLERFLALKLFLVVVAKFARFLHSQQIYCWDSHCQVWSTVMKLVAAGVILVLFGFATTEPQDGRYNFQFGFFMSWILETAISLVDFKRGVPLPVTRSISCQSYRQTIWFRLLCSFYCGSRWDWIDLIRFLSSS